MTVLRARLLKAKQAEEDAKYAKERKDQVGSGDRSSAFVLIIFPKAASLIIE